MLSGALVYSPVDAGQHSLIDTNDYTAFLMPVNMGGGGGGVCLTWD